LVKTIEICTHALLWAGDVLKLCEDHARDRLIHIENNGDVARLVEYNGIERCSDCEKEKNEKICIN